MCTASGVMPSVSWVFPLNNYLSKDIHHHDYQQPVEEQQLCYKAIGGSSPPSCQMDQERNTSDNGQHEHEAVRQVASAVLVSFWLRHRGYLSAVMNGTFAVAIDIGTGYIESCPAKMAFWGVPCKRHH